MPCLDQAHASLWGRTGVLQMTLSLLDVDQHRFACAKFRFKQQAKKRLINDCSTTKIARNAEVCNLLCGAATNLYNQEFGMSDDQHDVFCQNV